MKSKIKQKNSTGFTMIETLVAIAVLLLSIAGPLTIASRGIVSAAFARDQITAFHLAREAVELVRNQRDTNTITNSNWTNGLAVCFSPGCKVEPSTGVFSTCVAGNCPVLNINTVTGVYGYTTGGNWVETPFTRNITITNINPNEISISVTISWATGVLTKSFTIKENFLNWQ
ncbi:prepilin-type N-terminal cleavage/methylation domain-containing protein [Patescibacteria group bacterium]